MAQFQTRLQRLNTKAARCGLAPIRILEQGTRIFQRVHDTVGRHHDYIRSTLVPVHPGERAKQPVLMHRIVLDYPIVKLGQWQVVGKLEAVGHGNTLFCVTRSEADRVAMKQYAFQAIHCDHCRTRRKRHQGYVLRNGIDHHYQLVGSQCLRDFTGIDPAQALFLANMQELVRVCEGEWRERLQSGFCNAVDTLDYLTDVSFLSTEIGFVSATKARDEGTVATWALALRTMDVVHAHSLTDAYADSREAHVGQAHAARQWVKDKPPESGFDHNIKLILGEEAISTDPKHLAFAAAAMAQYRHHVATTGAAANKAVSQHLGQPGEKMRVTITVSQILWFDNPFAYQRSTALVLMLDTHGNRLVWRTGSCPNEWVHAKGQSWAWQVNAKVKLHDEYKGEKQTVVTHLKILGRTNTEGASTPIG